MRHAPFPVRPARVVAAALVILATASGTPRAAAAQQADGLVYAMPDGWTRKDGPNGAVLFTPDGLPRGRVVLVSALAPEAVAAPAAAYHGEVVGRVTSGGARWLLPPRTAALGDVLATTGWLRTSNGIPLWTSVYTARWGGRGQAFLLYANSADLLRAYQPVVETMVGGARPAQAVAGAAASSPAAPNGSGTPNVPNAAGAVDMSPAPAPPCYRPNGIEICPKAVLGGSRRAVPIIGAYLATAARTSFSVDQNDPGVKSRVSTMLLLLFGNGVAVRANAMKSGAIDDTYWAEGVATMDARDPSSLGARRAGRWTERDGTIAVAWETGPPSTLTRAGEGLTESGTRWTPYPSVDGLRLEGRYERVMPFGPPWSVTLHRNGTFTADGLSNTMGGSTINPGFPERGGGTYEITRWSLVLRFGTGFVQSINLLLGPGGPQNPADIVLNGHDYALRR